MTAAELLDVEDGVRRHAAAPRRSSRGRARRHPASAASIDAPAISSGVTGRCD